MVLGLVFLFLPPCPLFPLPVIAEKGRRHLVREILRHMVVVVVVVVVVGGAKFSCGCG
jgi:hypothetical protein